MAKTPKVTPTLYEIAESIESITKDIRVMVYIILVLVLNITIHMYT